MVGADTWWLYPSDTRVHPQAWRAGEQTPFRSRQDSPRLAGLLAGWLSGDKMLEGRQVLASVESVPAFSGRLTWFSLGGAGGARSYPLLQGWLHVITVPEPVQGDRSVGGAGRCSPEFFPAELAAMDLRTWGQGHIYKKKLSLFLEV